MLCKKITSAILGKKKKCTSEKQKQKNLKRWVFKKVPQIFLVFHNSQTQPKKQPHIQKSNSAWGWVRLAQHAFSIHVLAMRSCSCKEWIEEVEGGCHFVLNWSLNLGVEVFIEVVLESDASKQRGLCCLNFSENELVYANSILRYIN